MSNQTKELDLRYQRPDEHPQCIRDLQTFMYRIYNNPRLHPPQKVQRLEALADKFKSGWPLGSNSKYSNYGQYFLSNCGEYVNFLERQARALAHRIHQIELVIHGRNMGTVDKTENDPAKVHTTEKKEPEKKEPIIEVKS